MELFIVGVVLYVLRVENWVGIVYHRGGIFNYRGCGDGVMQHFVKGEKSTTRGASTMGIIHIH